MMGTPMPCLERNDLLFVFVELHPLAKLHFVLIIILRLFHEVGAICIDDIPAGVPLVSTALYPAAELFILRFGQSLEEIDALPCTYPMMTGPFEPWLNWTRSGCSMHPLLP